MAVTLTQPLFFAKAKQFIESMRKKPKNRNKA